MNNIKEEIIHLKINNKCIIRKDGHLNSPIVNSFKKLEIFQKIKELTSFLPDSAPLGQRWWHIKNDKYEYCKCSGCTSLITKWQRTYKKFCSQICAVTSDKARERTRITFTGGKISEKEIERRRAHQTGKKYNEEVKNKIRLQKIGSLNPRYGKEPWNKGLFGKNNPLFGKPYHGKVRRGTENPMFGKSPSPEAGKGINGTFNGIHFRSSLELFYLIYWYENSIIVESAEQKLFRIQYIDKEAIHNYTPDFYLVYENTLIEIKPEKRQEEDVVLKKFDTLKYVFEDMNCKILGYSELRVFIQNIILTDKIDNYLGYELIITDKQLQRLRKNYGSILTEVRRNSK
jgi:hypothetical protein